MSDTLANLRRKMDGAAKLGSVVRTMKALAASNIGQYENAVRSLADYHHTVQFGLFAFFRQDGTALGAERQERVRKKTVGAVVFGSD